MKFVLTSDIHIRPDAPFARIDEDYMTTQAKKLNFLEKVKEDTNSKEILNGGDTVHRSRERKRPTSFVNWMLEHMPYSVGVLGNHDLLDHNIEKLEDTTMGTLILSDLFNPLFEPLELDGVTIYGASWEEAIPRPERKEGHINILIHHVMVTEKFDPFLKGWIGKDLLAAYPEYDLILTGDNHKTFTVSDGGRHLINPGSLKRDNAGQLDHKPCVFVYDTETKTFEKVFVPIEEGVLSNTHILMEAEKDERIENLVNKFKMSAEVNLDFEENLTNFCKENEVKNSILHKLEKWKGGE